MCVCGFKNLNGWECDLFCTVHSLFVPSQQTSQDTLRKLAWRTLNFSKCLALEVRALRWTYKVFLLHATVCFCLFVHTSIAKVIGNVYTCMIMNASSRSSTIFTVVWHYWHSEVNTYTFMTEITIHKFSEKWAVHFGLFKT